MSQFRPTVRLARRYIKVRRHMVTLERPVHFNGLRRGNADIFLAHQKDRRSSHLPNILQRRVIQKALIGASFCHGVPPNHGVRYVRTSLCAYIEIQLAAPAPAEAALKRVVEAMILLVMCPPPHHPIFTTRSASAL